MKRLAQVLKYATLAVYGLCGLALLAFMVPATGLQAKSVITGSMRPSIPPGSLVIIRETPLARLATGDVVTYRKAPGSAVTITHRIIGKTEKAGIPYLITKGDANPSADVGVPGGAVIGKVVSHVPYVGGLATSMRGPAVLLLVVVLPGLVVIWNELNHLRRTLRAPASKPIILLVLVLAPIVVGATRAALTTNTAQITGIALAVTAAPATPAPCPGTVIVQNNGPGSTNTVTCHSSVTVNAHNTTAVTVTNTSTQTSSTGSASAVHNANTTHSNIIVNGF